MPERVALARRAAEQHLSVCVLLSGRILQWTVAEGNARRSFPSLERTREGHRQSDEKICTLSASATICILGYLQYSLSRRTLYDLERFPHLKKIIKKCEGGCPAVPSLEPLFWLVWELSDCLVLVGMYWVSRAFCRSSRLRAKTMDESTSFPSVEDRSTSEAAAGLPAGFFLFFLFNVNNFQGHTNLGGTESIANTQTPGCKLLHSQSAEIQRMAWFRANDFLCGNFVLENSVVP